MVSGIGVWRADAAGPERMDAELETIFLMERAEKKIAQTLPICSMKVLQLPTEGLLYRMLLRVLP